MAARHQELLLLTGKRCKLLWFGHICSHNTLPKIILRGTVDVVAEEDCVKSGGKTSRNGQVSC